MKKRNKKAPDFNPPAKQELNPIIEGKTYNIKELNSVFNINSLMLVETKTELLKYERMAIETGVKRYKEIVDTVYRMKYAV